jgi:hypothetical protein
LKIVGNKDVWRRFLTEKPQVALLRGPKSSGRETGLYLIGRKAIKDPENFLHLRRFYVEDANVLQKWAAIYSNRPKICIISAKKSSPEAWGRALALFEDPPDNTYFWITDYGTIPDAIKNRAYKYFFEPLTKEQIEKLPRTKTTVSLSPVLNWLDAVEDLRREELLLTVPGWKQDHTELLISELESQANGVSLLERQLTRHKPEQLLRVIPILQKDSIPSLSALVAGMALIQGI